MSAKEDYIPVGRYRGALTKEEALRMADEDEDDDDVVVNPLSMLSSKGKKKRAPLRESKDNKKLKTSGSSTLTKSQSKEDLKSSNKNIRNSGNINSNHMEPITIDDDDDDFAPSSIPSTNRSSKTTSATLSDNILNEVPELKQTFQLLQESKRLVSSLKSSSDTVLSRSSSAHIVDLDESYNQPEVEPATLVIGVKDATQVLRFKIYRVDPFQKVIENYAKYKGVNPNHCTLKSYGVPLKLTDTPKEWGMADNEILDIIVEAPKPVPPPVKENVNKRVENESPMTTPSKESWSSINNLDDDDDDDFQQPRTFTNGLKLSNNNNNNNNNSNSLNNSNNLKNSSGNNTTEKPHFSGPIDTSKLKKTLSNVEERMEKQEDQPLDEESIKLKVRLAGKADPLKFKINKSDPLEKLFKGFCTKAGLDIAKVRFMFDGMVLKPKQTPEDLDMEDDDLIDASST